MTPRLPLGVLGALAGQLESAAPRNMPHALAVLGRSIPRGGEEFPGRNRVILALRGSLRPDGKPMSAADVARQIGADFPGTTRNAVLQVWHRFDYKPENFAEIAPQALPARPDLGADIDAAARNLGISPERYRALSARRKRGDGVAGLGALGALALFTADDRRAVRL